jgi:2-polyprenyl-3-methyl-5-hydroxy-6-metoxy-1,4-benzoquinol methylase
VADQRTSSLAAPIPARLPGELVRNLLVRLLGWRALILQSDPPTWDRWRWVESHLHDGGRVLDAGSGSGGFTMYAAVRGHETVGLSFDDEANRLARRRAMLLGIDRVRFQTVDLRYLERYAGELGEFDQILCLETIEHLQNDAKLVTDLAGLLAPGGRLLLTTPFAGHRPLVGETVSATEDGGHVRWGYTVAELIALFEHAGLRIESCAPLSGAMCQWLTNLSRRLARLVGVRAAWVLTAPLRPLVLFDRPWSRVTAHPCLALAAVGVKV